MSGKWSPAVMVLVLAITHLLVAGPANAQHGFGLRGGLNLTNFVGDDAADDRTKTGLNLGGSFRLISLGPVAITPEVYYAQKGSVQDFTDPDQFPDPATEPELTFSLAYVEIPVLAQVRLPFGGRTFRPYLQAGPAFAWNLDCEIDLSDADSSTASDCEDFQQENIESTIEDYEVGAVVGGGTDIVLPRGVGALTLDARLTQGLSRLTEESEITNQAFTVMLGYSFGF